MRKKTHHSRVGARKQTKLKKWSGKVTRESHALRMFGCVGAVTVVLKCPSGVDPRWYQTFTASDKGHREHGLAPVRDH